MCQENQDQFMFINNSQPPETSNLYNSVEIYFLNNKLLSDSMNGKKKSNKF